MTTHLPATVCLAIGLTSGLAACQTSSTDIACTDDYRYGLNVTVLDSVSGAPVPRPLLIVATDGAFADTSQFARQTQSVPPFASWPLLGERAGRYSVRVSAAGYQPWQQDNVVITRDVCHVRPVSITARLGRAS